MRAASDTGGTFTDLVDASGRVAKVLSDPADPSAAVRRGLDVLGADGVEYLAHGTTVATNALLERKGARVALIADEGVEDVIEIARQDRPSLYDIGVDRPEPLVPRALRFGVVRRTGPDGRELEPVVPEEGVPELPSGVEAVAVTLLHSDLDPVPEARVAEVLRERGHAVSCSSEVSPEFREYERTVTTVVNAYLRPRCETYLRELERLGDEVLVMTSAGGLLPAAKAAELPVGLLLSGPAGGVVAGAEAARANDFLDAVTFDMGGTSTDVCLVLDGRPAPAAERSVGGLPIRQPSLDVHTIGAGGGSIAHVDPGGALVVGPESAGSVPGPACYGRGGRRPTVTDANLVAGHIPPDSPFPELGVLDLDAARRALADAGVTAEGVLRVVDANMERAVRTVSVERGVDPRGLALVAFGGAGPLHACSLAEALGMAAVVVPARAGVLSAVGILGSPHRRELVRSWPTPRDHDGLEQAFDALESQARELVPAAVEVTRALDCRYAGQSHELRVASVDAFASEHERQNGYSLPGRPIEVVALRVTAAAPPTVRFAELPTPERERATGPAVVAEPDCTIWVPEGWHAEPGAAGALILRRAS